MTPCIKEDEIKEIRDMTIEHRTDVKVIREAISDIKNNHLAHMQKSLESMEKEINNINLTMAKWVGAAAVIMFVIQLLINKYW